MRSTPPDWVCRALRDPSGLARASLAQWEVLVRDAREANLLGRIAAQLDADGGIDRVPSAPRAHLVAASTIAAAQARAARREIELVRRALAPLAIPVVLLKGAAYLMAGLPSARGRMFSDIDVLVAKETLPEVEAALMLAGWATTHLDPYDQRYYRHWMHELPPLMHVRRQSVLDVHHTILPPTSRLAPDAAQLIAAAVPLPDAPPLHVLAPNDLVLHSAAHLFQDEDLGHALRDLVDLDLLFRHFDTTPGFWPGLMARAAAMTLTRPLHYALRWSARLLGTPLPAAVLDASGAHAPPFPIEHVMDALLERAFRPRATEPATRWSRRFLYVRGHWLKMPPHLLAWHLAHKALRSPSDETA